MSVIDWLLEGDPAIRWQVLRDLTNAPAGDVAAERARVEHDGWGARLLALEDPGGLWDGGACFPASYAGGEPGQPWTATMHTLQTLQLFGLDPASESARQAIGLVAENGRWEHAGQRYFDGEVEPCINGRTIETGAYFGVDVGAIVERILGERLADGGWNCEAENGSVRSSFDTTIDVLDGLLEFERATGGSAQVRTARRSGEEYLLERGLFRRKNTGASSRRRIWSSRFRTTGTTTCCVRWITSEGRVLIRIRGWRRRWRSCGRSGSSAAGGCSTASTRVASTSVSRAVWARRAAGIPSARFGCSSGGTEPPDGRTPAVESCESLARCRWTTAGGGRN